MPQPGQLYLVATPIGNLGDITVRALEVLQSVDKIACEDTRHSMILLDHYGIHKPLVALHDHNEQRQVNKVMGWLSEGLNIALISDAGTPLISDPGYRLVSTCQQEGVRVVPMPGPCAAIAALSASGLPTDAFAFIGFLPVKISARQKQLQTLANETRTMIFYESPRRVLSTLKTMQAVFGGERQVVLARELTKTHETVLSLSIDDMVVRVDEDRNQQRGEIVIVLQGADKKPAQDEQSLSCEKILKILLEDMSLKQAVQTTVKITGQRRKKIYDMALQLVNSTL